MNRVNFKRSRKRRETSKLVPGPAVGRHREEVRSLHQFRANMDSLSLVFLSLVKIARELPDSMPMNVES